jgi:hypothetical protein
LVVVVQNQVQQPLVVAMVQIPFSHLSHQQVVAVAVVVAALHQA